MIRIDVIDGKRYFVEYPIFKEEETYNNLVEDWKNKNNRGISVALDECYHSDTNVTIYSDEIVQIIRK